MIEVQVHDETGAILGDRPGSGRDRRSEPVIPAVERIETPTSMRSL